MSNKFYVDVGTSRTVIYGKLPILDEPTCAVVKNGLFFKAERTGDAAIKQSAFLRSDEQLIFPVAEGGIRHMAAAVAMLKDFMKRAGAKPADEIAALVSCCSDAAQRAETEKLFVNAGYKNLFIMENILLYAPLSKQYGNIAVAVMGDSRTDVGIINGDEIVLAYTVDIGGNTIDERIKNKIERLYKLKISGDTAEKIKREIGSLYKNDCSSVSISGNDIITGTKKSASVHSADIYEEIEHCVKRIVNVIIGTIDAAPPHIADEAAQRGIFISGGASKIAGLADYIYKMTRLNCISADRPGIPM